MVESLFFSGVDMDQSTRHEGLVPGSRETEEEITFELGEEIAAFGYDVIHSAGLLQTASTPFTFRPFLALSFPIMAFLLERAWSRTLSSF